MIIGQNVIIESIGVAEAKRRFAELLDRVARGERFVIARHGKPAVALVPPEEAGEGRPRPKGILSLVGLLADWKRGEVEEMVRHIYAERRRTRSRTDPFA
jgi:prevent-host-death family protein